MKNNHTLDHFFVKLITDIVYYDKGFKSLFTLLDSKIRKSTLLFYFALRR